VQTDVAASTAFGVSGGIDWLGETGGSTFITAGAAGEVPIERSVLGFFGEGRWNAGQRAALSAGVRADRIARAALPGDPLAFEPRPDFPAEATTSVNPKLAGSVLVLDSTRLHGAFGTGIRPPDAFEIAFTDNSGLEPERSRSAEFGVSQVMARGVLQVDATAFFNNYADLIVAVGRTFSGVSRYRTDNISNASARGVELSAAWRLTAAFDVRGAYTFLDSEILAVSGSSAAPAPYAVGDPLLRRPRHAATLDATLTATRGAAFVQVQSRGETLDADPSFGPAGGLFANPGHTVVNLGASWRPLRTVEVFGRLQNLFDRQYEEVLGYPAPGRTAYLGARVAVGR
jgi:outer membrane receptor protein involved in Fe transport